MKGNDLILTGGGEWRASGGRDRETRGGVIGIVATVRERWLWPDEAAMFGPLAAMRGAGRVGGYACRTPAAECRESARNTRRAGGRRCGRHGAGGSIYVVSIPVL